MCPATVDQLFLCVCRLFSTDAPISHFQELLVGNPIQAPPDLHEGLSGQSSAVSPTQVSQWGINDIVSELYHPIKERYREKSAEMSLENLRMVWQHEAQAVFQIPARCRPKSSPPSWKMRRRRPNRCSHGPHLANYTGLDLLF